MKKTELLLSLLLTFARIGAFTFGGGYIMISLIENICVEKKKWITNDEFLNMTALAEASPGPIAIKCAAFAGYKQAGYIGAAISTLGMVFPSFAIIYMISLFFNDMLEIRVIANAFNGIKIAVGVLIVTVGAKMLQKMQKTKQSIAIMSCSLIALLVNNIFKLNVSSIQIILIAALAGWVSFAIGQKKAGRVR